MNKQSKQAWRISGLWSKDLPNGGTLLRAKIPLAAVADAVAAAQAAGMQDVELEVWEQKDAGPGRPTHSLRMTEPYQAKQSGQQRQAGTEAYPF